MSKSEQAARDAIEAALQEAAGMGMHGARSIADFLMTRLLEVVNVTAIEQTTSEGT